MLVQHQQCSFRFLFQKSIEPPHPGVPILLHIIFAAFAALPRQIPKICDLPRQIISAAKITGLVERRKNIRFADEKYPIQC